jgi:simple sugar transport system ATP-binding protein
LKNAGLRHVQGHWLLQNINLEVRAGQIVGLAGVAGSGQTPMSEVLVGLRTLHTGEYYFDSEQQKRSSVSKLIQKGIGYIPEDRKRYGIAPHLGVAENFLLRDLYNPQFQSAGWLQRDKVSSLGLERMRAFDVRAASEKNSCWPTFWWKHSKSHSGPRNYKTPKIFACCSTCAGP